MRMRERERDLAKYEFQPYEPCPCESGMKYKFCCYKKIKNITTDKSTYSAARLKALGQKYYKDSNFTKCYGFNLCECSDQGIRAHSLQKNGVLDQISEKNHVFHLRNNFNEKTLKPFLEFELIGKKLASTFYGFCKTHDEKYFKCIEDYEYKGSAEQHYAYAFRASCLETHKKIRKQKALAKFFSDNPEMTRILPLQIEHKNAKLSIKDNEIDYERFKLAYENKDYNQLQTFSRVLPVAVGFAATTAVAVGSDMIGDMAADIYNYDENLYIPSLYISVIPRKSDTLVLVSRFKDEACYETIFKQLSVATDIELQSYISFCLAEYSENVYYSPKKVRELTEAEITSLGKKFFGSVTPILTDRLDHLLDPNPLNLFELFECKQ